MSNMLEDFKDAYNDAYPDRAELCIKQVTTADLDLFREFVDDVLGGCRKCDTIEIALQHLLEKYDVFRYRRWTDDEERSLKAIDNDNYEEQYEKYIKEL